MNKKYDESLRLAQNAVKTLPNAENLLHLGLIYAKAEQYQEAEQAYIQGIQAEPEYTPLYAAILKLMALTGNVQKTLEWGYLALRADPENDENYENVVSVLSTLQPRLYNAAVEEILHLCLRRQSVDVSSLNNIWLAILKLHPQFGPFYSSASLKNYTSFEKKFPASPPLNLPLFMEGLKRLVIYNIEFERFLTFLRHWLLDYTDNDLPLEASSDYANLIVGLASYAHRTEYILTTEKDEQDNIEAIRSEIECANPVKLPDILLFSLYAPLTELKNREAVRAVLAQNDLETFLHLQIRDRENRETVKAQIKQLSPITNTISGSVREQYETFPYPRWGRLARQVSNEGHIKFLGTENTRALCAEGAKILIAGCGTGQQALEYARAFPNARILAIDLSLTSLSYALQKKEQHQLDNIDFKQADILELGQHLQPEYDMIVSTGVLHHMEDPEKGWAVLNALLKPGGIMRIALYSETARESLIRAQKTIEKKRIGSNTEGIRHFRNNINTLLKKDDARLITSTKDYYYLSECRDALFHVQEHLFTVPRIAGALENMGLKFYRFEGIPAPVMENFKLSFADNPAMDNLTHWHNFEQKNRMTFLQMYRFFCLKP